MSLGQPLVSIIIPCFKQAHFLGEAIESALGQTYAHVEVIVVDDGSPDHPEQVAARYPTVHLVRQKNQGISDARNAGIRESHGEFLIFLDADDRLRPRAAEAGLACMAERPEAMLVFGRYHCMNENGSLYPLPSVLYEGDIYRGLLVCNCIGMVAPVLYRREAFDAVGFFNSRVNGAEDYDFYLRIARLYPIHRHSEIVAEYRVHPSGASNNLGSMLRSVILALQGQRKYVKNRKEYEAAYHEGLRFWREYYGEVLYLQTARQMWQPRRWRRTMGDLWYLLRYYPQILTIHGGSRWAKLVARFKVAG